MDRRETLTIFLVALVLSISIVAVTGASNNFPSMAAVKNADCNRQLLFSAPLVIAAGLQNHTTPLSQPTRLQVYAYIRDNPGVHFRAICRGLGLSVGVVQYHVDILVHVGMVTIHKDGQYKRYFPSNTFTEADAKTISLLRHETKAKILTIITDKGSALHKELAEQLGTSSQVITWHMNQLKDAQLVIPTKEGMRVRYTPNPERAIEIRALLSVVGRAQN